MHFQRLPRSGCGGSSCVASQLQRHRTSGAGILRIHRHGRIIARVAEPQSQDLLDKEALQRPPPATEKQPTTATNVTHAPDADAECAIDTDCPVFVDPKDGRVIRAMCCDYGFRSGAMRMSSELDGRVPSSFLQLGTTNFVAELRRIVQLVLPFPFMQDDKASNEACAEIRAALGQLTLDDAAVEARGRTRPPIDAAWPIRVSFDVLCWGLDVLFANRPIQRFWALEVVARVPYFAYISMLHLYETLGWWRAGVGLRKVHFAEEYNELHHLMIMEALGGDRSWPDRFLAYHGAVAYFWLVIALYVVAPRQAYVFAELVEAHAEDTYAQFVEENEAVLRTLPPPLVALEYYLSADLYLFDSFQTHGKSMDGSKLTNGAGTNGTPSNGAPVARRPPCDTLYDVFCNVRDDEVEHGKTMHACGEGGIAMQPLIRDD